MVIKLIMSQPQSSNSTDQKSIVAQRHTVKEDCLACRLISGGGLIGISVYTYSQARKHPKAFNKIGLMMVTAAVAGIGVARLLDVYPFGDNNNKT